MSKGYVGWKVPDAERSRVLALMPSRYQQTILHHVTLAFGVDETYPLPLKLPARILGWADDGRGVQAAIIEIGGECKRSDGSTFHITWSLAEGRKAVESNDIVRNWPDMRLDPELQVILYDPEPIELEPMFFPFGR